MKGRFSLFIFRTKVIYDVILLYFMTFIYCYSDNRSGDNKLTFACSILGLLNVIYYSYLIGQKNKITFFYTPKNSFKLRFYALHSSILFSSIFLPMIILFGFLDNDMFNYIVLYSVIITSFYFANYFVKLSVEKEMKGNIVSKRDIFKAFTLTILLIFTVYYIIGKLL
ncbi:hypothetical protein BKX95_08675 [Streptococcus iniae]|nr:hypothetical protein BKX95_08675 [Streptococcus iniae]